MLRAYATPLHGPMQHTAARGAGLNYCKSMMAKSFTLVETIAL
jgi:hypothetical protein